MTAHFISVVVLSRRKSILLLKEG